MDYWSDPGNKHSWLLITSAASCGKEEGRKEEKERSYPPDDLLHAL